MKYTTKAKVEEFLGKTITNPNLDMYIEAVSREMDNITDRVLMVDTSQTPVKKVFAGSGNHELIIDDIAEITLLEVDGETVTDYYTLPLNSDYANAIILEDRTFPTGFGKVEITGHWGYFKDGSDLVTYIATVLVAGLVDKTAGKEVASETIGRYSVSFTSQESLDTFVGAKNMLQPLKRQSV